MKKLSDFAQSRRAKKKAEKAKNKSVFGHSDFWLGDMWEPKDRRRSTILSEEDEDDVFAGVGSDLASNVDFEKIQKLAAVRRAVANFVSIVAGENLPVMFNGGRDSYTDGKVVVIAADSNPKNFDVMVGLACHEAAHCLLSDFEHLKHVMHHGTKSMDRIHLRRLHPFIASKLKAYIGDRDEKFNEITDDIKTIMNIIEDRRIDHYVYNAAKGYRPYYDAMYTKYFYTKEISKNLRLNPAWRELTVDNYINRLLYFFHPDNDQNAMPGLKELIAYVDIPNLSRVSPKGHDAWKKSDKFEDQPPLWKLANEVYAIILRYVDLATERSKAEAGGEASQGTGNISDLPNLDGGYPSPDQMVETEADQPNGREKAEFGGKVEKEKQTAKDHMNGVTTKKKISKKDYDSVESFEKAQGKTVELNGFGVPKGVEVLVTRRVTKQMLDQDWFLFGRARNLHIPEYIAKGKRMGAILHHKLQVRNDPLVTHQTRLSNGKIDKRLLAQLGMENLSVFKRTRVDQHKPAMLHLSIDASGSMHGRKWDKAMATAVALAYVGTKLRNVDTVISIRGGNDKAMVSVVFDSRRDSFVVWSKEIAPFLVCNGATPESLCYQATLDIITEAADTHDVYFINFSDGEPAFRYYLGGKKRSWYDNNTFDYSGDMAVKHCRQMMALMRDRGVKVLSYFITSNNSDTYGYGERSRRMFSDMYGEDASFVDVDGVTAVLTTLNKLLRERA